MRLYKAWKYIVVFGVYVISLVWIGTKIWGTPESTFEQMIHQMSGDYPQTATSQDIKYSMNGEYITEFGHALFEITGYQVELISKKGEFTMDSILLRSTECQYSVDVIREKINFADRFVGMPVKSDKIGFRTIIPTNSLVAGEYEIGLLMQDKTVLWTSEYLVAQ